MLNPGMRKFFVQLGYRSIPDLLILGGKHCGTRSLNSMIEQHNYFYSGKRQSTSYFADGGGLTETGYYAQFPLPHLVKSKGIVFEGSPDYLSSSQAPTRIFNVRPDMLFIAIFREPAERAWAQWLYRKPANESTPDHFSDWVNQVVPLSNEELAADIDPIIREGVFVEHVLNYLQHFSRENFLLLDFHELRNRPHETMSKICDFVKVPNQRFQIKIVREDEEPSKLPFNESLQKLRAFYQPFNKRLFDLIGLDFAWLH